MRKSMWTLLCLLSAIALPLVARSHAAPAAAGGLPILEDDYSRARALARERKLPLFIDVWAPW